MTRLKRLIPIDWEKLAHKYPRTWDFIKKYWKDAAWVVVLVVLLVNVGLCYGSRKSRQTINAAAPPSGLTIQSAAFAGRRGGDEIPARYTADGQDYSPQLEFVNLPAGTVELALIMEDPDAGPEPFVHWVIYRIAPGAAGLVEGVPAPVEAPAEVTPKRPPGRQPPKPGQQGEKPAQRPAWGVQGTNSFGTLGYRGPAPAPGSGTHHYHFRLYALNAALEAEQGLSKAELLALMQGKIIEEAEVVGTYRR